jgi:hypothetical protein
MQHGHWREVDFPKSGWMRIGKLIDLGPEQDGPHPRRHWQQCGMCQTAVCRYLYHLEHADPTYRWLNVGEECALGLTGGDLRTPEEREADEWKEEHTRIRSDPSLFERACLEPWSRQIFDNFGWTINHKGHPWRKLADGNVTLFRSGAGWKIAVFLDEIGRPKYSRRVYPTVEAARETAWDMLNWLRRKER